MNLERRDFLRALAALPACAALRAADPISFSCEIKRVKAGLTLTFERRGGDFVVEGDEDRLVQVMVNLVANAIRFTLRRGRVTVRLHDAGTFTAKAARQR